ncbi:RHS repeat-associated core domain-containing protein [Pseudomonas sp. GM60]|uniref:RHS repeat-associated core domain-containing protein n=1 Tax=Pseudomonas sp. GM60 TaxID=1144334 RepID=UPI0002709E00|nr:RHS repeat-associated core domain protein-containing protein [Pseudomonas sp. GM60]
MHVQAQEVLCCYHYDALDWLTGTTSERDAELQRFYCKSRLATEVQGGVQRSIFQHDDLLLAQHNQQGVIAETSLMATDQMRSVLQTVETNQVSPIAYSPYGHRSAAACLLSLLGFNGERPDPVTGYYLLGNGYRAFNPTLMRFNSPDSFSPFDGGGLNSYSYCIGDPVNRYDDSGHLPKFLQSIFRMFVKTPNVESVMPPVSSTGRRLTLYDSNLTEYDELMYKQIPKNHQFRHKIPPKK